MKSEHQTFFQQHHWSINITLSPKAHAVRLYLHEVHTQTFSLSFCSVISLILKTEVFNVKLSFLRFNRDSLRGQTD